MGQKVLEQQKQIMEGQDQIIVSTYELQPGSYIMEIVNNDNRQMKKILKVDY